MQQYYFHGRKGEDVPELCSAASPQKKALVTSTWTLNLRAKLHIMVATGLIHGHHHFKDETGPLKLPQEPYAAAKQEQEMGTRPLWHFKMANFSSEMAFGSMGQTHR